MGGRDDGHESGIVWLEDGDEVPFEPAGPRRPWLEESSERDGGRAAGEGGLGRGRRRGDPPELVWL